MKVNVLGEISKCENVKIKMCTNVCDVKTK